MNRIAPGVALVLLAGCHRASAPPQTAAKAHVAESLLQARLTEHCGSCHDEANPGPDFTRATQEDLLRAVNMVWNEKMPPPPEELDSTRRQELIELLCNAAPDTKACLDTYAARRLPPYVKPPSELVAALGLNRPGEDPEDSPGKADFLALDGPDVRWTPTYQLRLILVAEEHCGQREAADEQTLAACRARVLDHRQLQMPALLGHPLTPGPDQNDRGTP